MNLVSYNLRSGGKTGIDNHWQRMILEFLPDILFTQESLHPDQYLSAEEISHFKGGVHDLVPHGKWGSAILSRYPLEPLSLAEFKGWVVGAKIPSLVIAGVAQSITIFSIHAPSPGPYEPSVNKILDEILRVWDKTPLILAGDFNLTTALGHASEVATKNTSGERKLLTRLRREFGLVNTWQTLHPNENLPQTLRWNRNPLPPFHCDAIFLSHSLLPHLVSADIECSGHWGAMSDHNPVLASLA